MILPEKALPDMDIIRHATATFISQPTYPVSKMNIAGITDDRNVHSFRAVTFRSDVFCSNKSTKYPTKSISMKRRMYGNAERKPLYRNRK